MSGLSITLQAQTTDDKKAEKLLDILERRDDKHFKTFIDALTDQEDVQRMLTYSTGSST